MPVHKKRKRKAPVKRRARSSVKPALRPAKRKRRAKGGKLKPSTVLGSASTALTGVSALGFDAPITLPLAGLTGIASAITKLFGFGGLTAEQAKILQRAQRSGLVVSHRRRGRR